MALPKTTAFIKKGLVAWSISVSIFLILGVLAYFLDSELLIDFGRTVFMFGVCGIPIILFFSAGLRWAEKKIKGEDKKEEQ